MSVSNTQKISNNVTTDQFIAGTIFAQLEAKKELIQQQVSDIAQTAVKSEEASRNALSEAIRYVERVRDFTAPDHLSSILGSAKSKHGEIAEQVEVQITNAKSVLYNLPNIADIDSVGRTAPEDYLINGVPVQSKFIAGFNKSLDHVCEHIEKYPNFTQDAAAYGYPGQQGYYHIPKDQFETIQKILGGETGEFNQKSVNACHALVRKIEEQTGKNFTEVVKPSLSNYSDVQIGTIDKTLNTYEKEFTTYTHDKNEKINDEAKEKIQGVYDQNKPSLGDACQAGAIGAVIGGSVSAAIKVYSKIKSGKKITQFALDDWKEVGVDFGKGAIRGGVSGSAIYALTQYAGIAAPFAGAIASTGIGITSLVLDYKAGKISALDFNDAACALSVEAGLSAVGTALGTAFIPIPVVGSIIGAMAARAALEVTRQVCGNKEKELIAEMEARYNEFIRLMTLEQQKELEALDKYFNKLNGLIAASMDKDVNIQLNASIELSRHVGLQEKDIIHNIDELDDFMLS